MLDDWSTIMSSRNVLWYGTEEPLPDKTDLRAGPLSAVFQSGDLRYIRVGGAEVLRRVYVAVRDRNWGTVPASIRDLSIKREGGRFAISYLADNRQAGIRFQWKSTISGEPDGTIVWKMEGKALSGFLKNRIGFCVLHPIRECAGRSCQVEKTDGTVEPGVFPRQVAPHQPFTGMRAIRHEPAPGLTAEVRFSGDVFEMEDQRNWTDASYKTYSTPLSLPFPVEIQAGTEVVQEVRISVRGRVPKPDQPAGRITFRVDAARRTPVPGLGLGIASHGRPLTVREVERLKALNLSHLRADIPLADPRPALSRAAAQSKALGVPLELALRLPDSADRELTAVAAALEELKPRVARWLIMGSGAVPAGTKQIQLARRILSKYEPSAQFYSGTDANFAEFNRNRPDPSVPDGACFSVNPQVHASDNETLVENVAAQAGAVESARAFLGRVPVAVTPVTLRARFNAVATGAEAPPPPGELPKEVDPRQMSLFGAGWTLGSLKYLSESGVESVTCYETTGWRGVMETEEGSPLPERFRSLAGSVFPMYHVFADLGEFAGGEVPASESSRPLAIDGMVLSKGGRMRILLANMTALVQPVTLSTAGLPRKVRLHTLDEGSGGEAMRSPEAFRRASGRTIEVTGHWLELTLRPFALLRIDAVHE